MSIKTYKTRDIAKRMTAKRSLLADRRNNGPGPYVEVHESTQYEVRELGLTFVGGLSSELANNTTYSRYRIIAQYSCGYLVTYHS